MAQAMASMAVLEGSLQLISGSTCLNVAGNNGRMGVSPRPGNLTVIRAQQQMGEQEITSRRSMLGLVAGGLAAGSFVQTVFAEAIPIKVGPPPPPSGGLPGTENSDEARDLDLNLKNRFYLQPLPATAAAARAKESAKEIVGVKKLIDKKAWPYVQNDLRLRASYLRYDLNTIIASKPKDEKKTLKELTGKLFDNISALDHAAKVKSSSDAEKSYASTVSALDEVIAKLG